MAGREVAELAELVTAAGPDQSAEGWYSDMEQKNDPKFRGLFASCAT